VPPSGERLKGTSISQSINQSIERVSKVIKVRNEREGTHLQNLLTLSLEAAFALHLMYEKLMLEFDFPLTKKMLPSTKTHKHIIMTTDFSLLLVEFKSWEVEKKKKLGDEYLVTMIFEGWSIENEKDHYACDHSSKQQSSSEHHRIFQL
jgi:hypothetical protein